MPNWRNSDSMPNVRASSGMIGTTRLPICGFFMSVVSRRTNAMVVDGCGAFEPPIRSAKFSSGGAWIWLGATFRSGM